MLFLSMNVELAQRSTVKGSSWAEVNALTITPAREYVRWRTSTVSGFVSGSLMESTMIPSNGGLQLLRSLVVWEALLPALNKGNRVHFRMSRTKYTNGTFYSQLLPKKIVFITYQHKTLFLEDTAPSRQRARPFFFTNFIFRK